MATAFLLNSIIENLFILEGTSKLSKYIPRPEEFIGSIKKLSLSCNSLPLIKISPSTSSKDSI